MSYVLESKIRVKSYYHSNFLRASTVKYRASWYIMSPNRTSEWNVMTILISRELPLFNFERLDKLCPWIEHPSEMLWPFLISRELPLLNFERLDQLCPRIKHPCEKLWPFEFLERFHCSISRVSIYDAPESDLRVKSYDHLNISRTSVV